MATMYKAANGWVNNPLVNGELRNLRCPCSSNKKVKNFCGRVIFIPEQYQKPLTEWAEKAKQARAEYGKELTNILQALREADQQNLIINKE